MHNGSVTDCRRGFECRKKGDLCDVCVAEEERRCPTGCCLTNVTGEGRAQLDVRLSRDQPVPLVSVSTLLSQSLQGKKMLDWSDHVTAELQVMVESAL